MKRTISSALLASVLLAACGATVALPELNTSGDNITVDQLPSGVDAVIKRVIDGDTIVVGSNEKVRLIGVDTPETVKLDTPVQCFGPEASNFTKVVLPKGTKVRLVFDAERTDKYQRTLAYVFRSSDLLFINATLVRGGYARTLRIKPNTEYANAFDELQNRAKAASDGLWGQCPATSN
jgi:micrococcal nuclease